MGALVFLSLLILAAALVAPVLAIVALIRASRLESELKELRLKLTLLEGRVARARVEAAAPTPAAPPTAVPPPKPEAPIAPPIPATVPSLPRPVAKAERLAERAVASPPGPAAAVVPAPPPERATVPPPRPPRREAPPPAPPAPSFDWESLLGLKGAAWAGGVALVIAALLLAKLAYDAGLFTPALRIAALLLGGVCALGWAELSLRRGYATTANAVSGAGIATLYIAFFAGHSLFGLIPLGPTFAMMVLVTIVAGLLAIRYDALFTAVLGLLGGFATPVALSTGVDRPFGLFSYILLLNVGLMAVALRKRWHGLVLMALAGTFLIELGWFGKFMAPEKMVIGLVSFLLFGLLYLLLPVVSERDEDETLLPASAVGALVPFLFGLALAGRPGFAGQWPLLFLYLGLLDAALVAVGLLRGRVGLIVSGSVATALAAILNAAPRLAAWLAPEVLAEHAGALEAAGLVGTVGLGLWTLVLVVTGPGRGLGEPPWCFLTLLAALVVLLVERTEAEERLRGAMLAGALATALLILVWFARATAGDTLLRNLSVPLLYTLALSLVTARRAGAPVDAVEDEAAVVGANVVGLLTLFPCLGSASLGGDPWPLFAFLAVSVVLFLASAVRRDWSWLVPASLVASALFALAWNLAYFHPSDLPVVLPTLALFHLGFLALPFVLSAGPAPRWRERPLPWLASALSGPAFFPALYDAASRGFGKDWIGALPVALAANSVAALAGVSRRFPAPSFAGPAGLRRLRHMALFAAIALGFVALAIPLQLDRQWITIGWALEAAAVLWLFGRLPHPGLKYFGALLLSAVGVRLLVNPEVMRYQERGLPILNWLLYTYGVPALCCFAGAALLKRAEERRTGAPEHDAFPGDRTLVAPAASVLGLVLVFWLINLEIFDYFSAGRYLEFSLERKLARDLSLSAAWGIYALVLLVLGLVRRVRGLRFLSLGFMLLTVAKVFLYDLSKLTGVYRIASFLGLGVSLILVSLLYQRFVLGRERAR